VEDWRFGFAVFFGGGGGGLRRWHVRQTLHLAGGTDSSSSVGSSSFALRRLGRDVCARLRFVPVFPSEEELSSMYFGAAAGA
jgi:hypothetical protein